VVTVGRGEAGDPVALVRRETKDYFPTFTDCDATACQWPSRITQTSVQTYLPLLSLPLYVLFSVSLPVTTAVLPNTLTFREPN